MTYYNENDKVAAAWLRNLITAGLIPPGDVDTRSIADVKGSEVTGYTQCHFFAGIGGWPLALQLADWPSTRPVWTGSCPCQPFSVAGKRAGTADKRHLWPEFARLINECRPQTIFGEQVASADGRKWLAGVFADLERMGYRRAGADLCAAGLAAPHIRQRLWWVADFGGRECETGSKTIQGRESKGDVDQSSSTHGLADSEASNRRMAGKEQEGHAGRRFEKIGGSNNADKKMHMPDELRLRESRRGGDSTCEQRMSYTQPLSATERRLSDPWRDYVWLPCADDKQRRVKPGIFPLAYGLPRSVGHCRAIFEVLGFLAKATETLTFAKRNRIVRLRGYGNAIVPQVAAAFIKAYLEVR